MEEPKLLRAERLGEWGPRATSGFGGERRCLLLGCAGEGYSLQKDQQHGGYMSYMSRLDIEQR